MFRLVKLSPDKLALNVNSRFEVLIQKNVVSVELKAVFVIYDDLLDTLEAAHKNIIDVFKQCPDPRSAVLGSEVSAEMLHRPLAYLWRTKRRLENGHASGAMKQDQCGFLATHRFWVIIWSSFLNGNIGEVHV